MSEVLARLVRRRSFSQADLDAFAALSGDDNPIHVEPAYAARTRFGRPVAHGMLLLTALRGLAEDFARGRPLAGSSVRFPAPARTDEPLTFELAGDDAGAAFTIRSDETGQMVCDGRFDFGAAAQGGAPQAIASAPLAGFAVGDAAEATRGFSRADVGGYVALGGERPRASEVPGVLLGGLVSRLLGVDLPGPGANYLKQDTAYLAAALLDEPVRARVEIVRLRPDKALVDLVTLCQGLDGRILCRGRALIFIGDRPAMNSP